ncbi:Nuclear respiratory factor 1 [Varanus komodoensis]|nr:Nuclear respiratory factor 1 [Varanus komodoensis]
MAAAAAVATGKKRKRPHVFESNPSIRKRQQTRLLRKLRATLDEYTTRVGQQAIVLCISPSKPNPVFKVFGAAPLENVEETKSCPEGPEQLQATCGCPQVRKYKSMILEDLESALLEHAPAPQEVNSELPPLTIDGIPVSVDKMTQTGMDACAFPEQSKLEDIPASYGGKFPGYAAQLRAFIPEMLKYSTGRGKPGWGKESCKPVWWPEDIPWANVRSDVRTEEQKQRVSWTQALRTIVKNCYKQHGREDLLYAFEDQQTQPATATHSIAHLVPSQTVVQTFSNPDGTVSLIQVGTGATVATLADASELPTTVTVAQVNYSAVTDGESATLPKCQINVSTVSFGKTVAHSGTREPAVGTVIDLSLTPRQKRVLIVSLNLDVEQNWATLQGGEMTIQTTQASEATQAVASLAEAAVAASQEMQQGATVTMALNSEAAAHAVATLAEATLQGGGQIVLSGETAAAVGALTGVQDANGLAVHQAGMLGWTAASGREALQFRGSCQMPPACPLLIRLALQSVFSEKAAGKPCQTGNERTKSREDHNCCEFWRTLQFKVGMNQLYKYLPAERQTKMSKVDTSCPLTFSGELPVLLQIPELKICSGALSVEILGDALSVWLVQIPVSMYQTVVTSLAQGNGPVQVAMAPVAARITDSTVTMDGQAVEVVTLEQ